MNNSSAGAIRVLRKNMDEAQDGAQPENAPENAGQAAKFACARCGYVYERMSDREPYLCFRCMQYLSKTVFRSVTEDKHRELIIGRKNDGSVV